MTDTLESRVILSVVQVSSRQVLWVYPTLAPPDQWSPSEFSRRQIIVKVMAWAHNDPTSQVYYLYPIVMRILKSFSRGRLAFKLRVE